MVDSESVAVGGEVAAWVTDCLVVDEAGCECEQPECDADAQSGDGAAAVAFEGELAFAGPDRRLDPWGDRSERAVASPLVFSIRSQEPCAVAGHELFELLAGEALVGEHGVTVEIDALEHLRGDLALRRGGWGELEADRHPVGRAQQIEPKAPEEAAVALAPAVGRVAGEFRAASGFARL